MKIIQHLVSILPALAPLVASPSISAQQAGQSPVKVFILADDLGWRDLGCFGSTFHRTPNSDALARQGVRFSV